MFQHQYQACADNRRSRAKADVHLQLRVIVPTVGIKLGGCMETDNAMHCWNEMPAADVLYSSTHSRSANALRTNQLSSWWLHGRVTLRQERCIGLRRNGQTSKASNFGPVHVGAMQWPETILSRRPKRLGLPNAAFAGLFRIDFDDPDGVLNLKAFCDDLAAARRLFSAQPHCFARTYNSRHLC